ncbi:unnamed protein product [Gordionus sp. m RMFG-2023]|uniref:uncharacterized protein LOC135930695 n=1 Tax=Gordionus sp. m RMFG-2023 TaxID=3053472 RepID=UPI0030DF9FED
MLTYMTFLFLILLNLIIPQTCFINCRRFVFAPACRGITAKRSQVSFKNWNKEKNLDYKKKYNPYPIAIAIPSNDYQDFKDLDYLQKIRIAQNIRYWENKK